MADNSCLHFQIDNYEISLAYHKIWLSEKFSDKGSHHGSKEHTRAMFILYVLLLAIFSSSFRRELAAACDWDTPWAFHLTFTI